MSTDTKSWGPKTEVGQWVMNTKYLEDGETFKQGVSRVADALKDSSEHFLSFREILGDQRFLVGGRIMAAMGATRRTTPLNCYVMDTISDSMKGILKVLGDAAETMRLGGGVGYDFSTLRPRGANIKTLSSESSGPVSFMDVFNAMCGTISSAGHRRGAQMGVLNVAHPDIEEFIESKCNHHRFLNFNISVAVTDEFMRAVENGEEFQLRYPVYSRDDASIHRSVDARALWDKILRATWDWAEPGVLFIDQINRKNNLWYCERIAATNPCGEQPLPPHGACLLGSFNLTKYLRKVGDSPEVWGFDIHKFIADIPPVVRALDNVYDRAIFPLEEQKAEGQNKRRMGLGITGLANAGEVMGMAYGSPAFIEFQRAVMTTLRDAAYRASIELAKEKGPFKMFDPVQYIKSEFVMTLPPDIQEDIMVHGIRNSHLLSVAPTGTISMGADNVSSGIEPVFSLESLRNINTKDGIRTSELKDWAWANHKVRGRTTDKVTIAEHLTVLNLASSLVDSAVSKTVNIGDQVTWDEFKDVYYQAWKGGASGCTTFRISGERMGMMVKKTTEDKPDEALSEIPEYLEGTACYVDPQTGVKTCE